MKIQKLEDKVKECKEFSDTTLWSNKVLKNRLAAIERDQSEMANSHDIAMEKAMQEFDETMQRLGTLKDDYEVKTDHLYKANDELSKAIDERDKLIQELESRVKLLEEAVVREKEIAQEKEIELIKKFKQKEITFFKNELLAADNRNYDAVTTKRTIDEPHRNECGSRYETIDTYRSVNRSRGGLSGGIEEIALEIRKTESVIKQLSISLSKENQNNSTREFKELADSLEENTQRLVELKALYNDLYKKLII
jgi:DNA repair exonuclease SbcCD ATPase subunit